MKHSFNDEQVKNIRFLWALLVLVGFVALLAYSFYTEFYNPGWPSP